MVSLNTLSVFIATGYQVKSFFIQTFLHKSDLSICTGKVKCSQQWRFGYILLIYRHFASIWYQNQSNMLSMDYNYILIHCLVYGLLGGYS